MINAIPFLLSGLLLLPMGKATTSSIFPPFIDPFLRSLQATTETTNNQQQCLKPGEKLSTQNYDILAGLTSTPMATCTTLEEQEIAIQINEAVDEALSTLIHVVETQNKICTKSIHRRSRSLSEGTETVAVIPKSATDEQGRSRELYQFSFLYRGVGRCYLCTRENTDQRRRLLSQSNNYQSWYDDWWYDDDDDDDDDISYEIVPTAKPTKTPTRRKRKSRSPRRRSVTLTKKTIFFPRTKAPRRQPTAWSISKRPTKFQRRTKQPTRKPTAKKRTRWSMKTKRQPSTKNPTKGKTKTKTTQSTRKKKQSNRGTVVTISRYSTVYYDHFDKIGDSSGWNSTKTTTASAGIYLDDLEPSLGPMEGGDEMSKAYHIRPNIAQVSFIFSFSESGSKEKQKSILEMGGIIFYINGFELDPSILISSPNVKTVGDDDSDDDLFPNLLYGKAPNGMTWDASIQTNFSELSLPDQDIKISIPAMVYALSQTLDVRIVFRKGFPGTKISVHSVEIIGKKISYNAIKSDDFKFFKLVAEPRIKSFMVSKIENSFYMKQGHCLYHKKVKAKVTLNERESFDENTFQC